MPEGHTVHRLATRHADLFAGRTVTVSSPQGRFAADAARVSGHTLTGTEAVGKHLLHHYGDLDLAVHVHLGLYGKFTDGPAPLPPPVGEIRLRMHTSEYWLDLRGPNACEILDGPAVEALRARLGEDPLRGDAVPERAYEKIRTSRTGLAQLLLSQRIVAGTGLIFVTEALFRAALAPTTPGDRLKPDAWERLWADLCALMARAERVGRIDTVRDAHTPEAMGRPPRVDRHGGEVYVYRRTGQPCLVCGTPVAKGALAGRHMYWCPTCQPRP